MSDYSIYVLGESQLAISGGGQLDGVTQGDGSHLVGRTITFNSNAWAPVEISDGSTDSNFQDNDGNQVLNGTHTIDGVSFATGTRVEAEYGITLSDGVNTWQAIGFNVNNSSPSYATIEGLAIRRTGRVSAGRRASDRDQCPGGSEPRLGVLCHADLL